jgi:hypothetical protein
MIDSISHSHEGELLVREETITKELPSMMKFLGEDKLCWAPSKRGLFNVRSFYMFLFPMVVLLSLGRMFGGRTPP